MSEIGSVWPPRLPRAMAGGEGAHVTLGGSLSSGPWWHLSGEQGSHKKTSEVPCPCLSSVI